MKLVTKLTVAFMIVTCAVLAINGVLRVRHEVRAFHADLVLDHGRIAHALAQAASAVRATDGPDASRAFIHEANARDGSLAIRWVCDPGRPLDAHVSCDELATLSPAAELSRVTEDGAGRARMYTWVRVSGDASAGAIEVSEPAAAERTYSREVFFDSLVSAASMAIAFALTAFSLGTLLVGRPTRKLIDAARRIGRGDFEAPPALESADELGALAVEMRAMASQLREATDKAAEETRARIATLEQLRHVDRLLTVGRLASGIAHEMGTPLNVVEVRASMIATGEIAGEPARQAASVIVESCERMTRTIGQLLAFARPQVLERTASSVARLARQTVALVAPLGAKSRVEIEVEAAGDAVANVDELQVQQALTNLVMNAVQAMPGGGHVRVLVEAVPEAVPPEGASTTATASTAPKPFVRVRVEDDGPGIAPEHLAHIFDPFFTTKDVGSGTGLGLSIADNIVRDHGGWIAVSASRPKGTAFEVFLPSEVT
ncbi:MAG: HAMP domain-containing histidine kinase [Labilithrix sp.]|nr:HAMP domain-containing histidine kinase [Labilithrix sp.]